MSKAEAVRRMPSGFCGEVSTLPSDVSPNIGGLDFIEHPALVPGVVGVLFAKVVSNHFPGALFVGVAEFLSKFGRFISSHSLECRLRSGHNRDRLPCCSGYGEGPIEPQPWTFSRNQYQVRAGRQRRSRENHREPSAVV